MAEQMNLSVEERSAQGKGPNRRLRAEGLVPGIYYSPEHKNISVQVKELPLSKLYAKVGTARIFNLQLGSESRPSLIKEIVFHPVKKQIVHVDFYGVNMNKEIRIAVPVEVTGKPKGAMFGGVLEIFRETIEVLCLPANIPDKIVLDVTPLEINDNIHIQNVPMPEGVKAVYEDNFAVLGLQAPVEEEEAAPAAEGAEGAAAAAPAAAAPAAASKA